MVRARDSFPGNRGVVFKVVLSGQPFVCTTQFLTADPRLKEITDEDWTPIPSKAISFDYLEADDLAQSLGVHAHALVLSGNPDPDRPSGSDRAPFSLENEESPSVKPVQALRMEARIAPAARPPVKLFGYDPFA